MYLIHFKRLPTILIKDMTHMARQRKVGLDKLKIPLKIFGISVKMGCTWIIRPWFLFWEKFRSDARQATTHVSFKKYQAENERNSILCSRARIIKMRSEASFQPLLQLYLLIPQIVRFGESSPKANPIETSWDELHSTSG